MKKYLPFLFLPFLFLVSQSYAASFVIPDGTTVTSTQILTNPGDTGLIEEGGAIIINDTYGVMMNNVDQSVENNGNITMTGLSTGIGKGGVYLNSGSNNGTVVNNGNINLPGNGYGGVSVEPSNNATVVNNGNINMSGIEDIGITISSSSNVNVTNNGSIISTGDPSIGIAYFGGSNSTIRNNGSIIMSGDNSFGIYDTFFLFGFSGHVIDNAGTIEMTGLNSPGIFINNIQNSTVNNTGSISTTGSNSNGVHIQNGVQNSLNNKGLIDVIGAGSTAVFMGGNNSKVTNSGTISSANGYALNFDGVGNSLALEVGSIIAGEIITTDDALNLEVARGLNAVITLDDAGLGFGEITSSSPYIVVGNTAIFIDPTGWRLEADLLSDLTSAALDSVYQSRFGFGSNCCAEDCSCEIVKWIQGVGGNRKRLNHPCSSNYTINDGGVMAGIQRSFYPGYLGVFGGVIYSNAKAGYRASETKAVSALGGLSFENLSCNNFFGASVAVGYVNYKNDRYIANNLAENGIEKARCTSDASLIISELDWSHNFPGNPLSPTLTAQVRYAGLFHGRTSESGSEYNMRFGHRATQIVTGRLEVGTPFSLSCGNGCLALEPYFGGTLRWQVGNKDIDAVIEDTRFSFTTSCRSPLSALLYGLRASKTRGQVNYYLNVEGSVDSYTANRVVGQIGFAKTF